MKRFVLPVILGALLIETAAAQSAIFLVRHAERADAGNSGGTNVADDPDLSEAGRARAEWLTKMLKDAGITAVYATEFKRTQQTAEGPARAAGTNVTILPAKDTAGLISKLKKTRGNALVVGHSNTLPEIIRALGIAAPITIGDADYDNLFVCVPGTPPQLIHLHYR
jgi:broad specificity phosphatase PhoE